MSRVNANQIELLINFMINHPYLVHGKFSNELTMKKKQELWQELTGKLNAMNGCEKSMEKWQKTWIDLKSNIKKKAQRVKKSCSQTGGGKSNEMLSEIEEKVIGLMGIELIEGISGIKEGTVIANITEDYILPNIPDETLNSSMVNEASTLNSSTTNEASTSQCEFIFEAIQPLQNQILEEYKTPQRRPKKRKAVYFESGRSKDVLKVQEESTEALKKIADALEKKNELKKEQIAIEKEKLLVQKEFLEVMKSVADSFNK